MRSDPIFSVVIPTRDNIPYLHSTLESIKNVTDPNLLSKLEIIVVSNGGNKEKESTFGFISGYGKTYPTTIKLLHTNSAGFSHAVNFGLKESKGQYLMFLNDDVVVSEGWLSTMVMAMEQASTEYPKVKFGYCGPRSNNVMDVQLIPRGTFPNQDRPEGANETAQLLRQSPNPNWTPTQVISGFCFLMTREMYEAVGDLTSFGLGGFEDNDYCLRAVEKGYIGLIANKAFIFHFGQQTLSRVAPRSWWGDRGKFLEKWNSKKGYKTLCVSYRVRISSEHDLDLLTKSVEVSSKLGDWVVILDDNSVFDLSIVFKNNEKVNVVKSKFSDLNEVRDRQILLELAQSYNPDWIMNLDHDEYPDESVTPSDLQRLMNPVDPQTKMYALPMAHFWRGTTHCRADGVWGNLFYAWLWKNEKAWGGIEPRGSNLHCRRAPHLLPNDATRFSTVFTIKHLGYADYEKQVLPKYDYYNEVDRTEDKSLIGSENYSHFIDESHMCLLKYKANKVDLLYLVKDEVDDLLTRIQQYHHQFSNIIVVHTGLGDEVKKICDTYGVQYYKFSCCSESSDPEHLICDFSAARNFAIEKSNADYIAFMDPDEEFIAQTISKLDKVLLDGPPDAVMCDIHNLRYMENGKDIEIFKTQQPRIFRNTPILRYNDPVHETLERAVRENPHLRLVNAGVVINHFGFLKTDKTQRKQKNDRYAKRLEKFLDANPNNARALFSLAVDRIENDRIDEGENLMVQALELDPAFWTARWEVARRLSNKIITLLNCPENLRPKDERWQYAAKFLNDLVKYFPEMAQR